MTVPAISFPPIPDKLPPMVAAALAGMRRDRRTRLLQGLYLLGASGLSVERELRAVMEMALGVSEDNASVKRIFAHDLPRVGWVIRETPYFIRSSRLAILRLSDMGRQVCNSLSWPTINTEWDQLIHSHEGNLYNRHTLGLLAFSWQARIRNWRTTILPIVNAPIEPDFLLNKSGVEIYAEFETRAHEKLEKWKKVYRFQGYVAICTFVSNARFGLVADCKSSKVPGIATDLQTLLQLKYSAKPKSLWLETWRIR